MCVYVSVCVCVCVCLHTELQGPHIIPATETPLIVVI